jgi:S-DNA-T family DNA segregation ATPase FtsK/SpoIIIE
MAEKKKGAEPKLKESPLPPIIHDEPDVDEVGEPRLRRRKIQKRKSAKEVQQEKRAALRDQTKRGIAGVACLAFATFFTLAGFSLAGYVGELVFGFLTYLFGTGYALIPVSLCLWSVALFKDITQRVAFWRGIGTGIFFFASLSLIHTISPKSGGLVGSVVTNPLIAAIAIPATVTLLLALITISLMLIFDTQLKLPSWFTARPDEEVDDIESLEISSHLSEPEAEIPVADIPEEVPSEEAERPRTRGAKQVKVADEEAAVIPVLTQPLRDYTPPPLSLLEKNKGKPTVGDVKANANIIKRTLQNFGIDVEMDEVSIGPSVTRFALKPAEGVRLSRIVSLQNNLELALAASPVRIEAPIPGKALVGIEVPNQSRTMLGMGSILSNDEFKDPKKPLMIALGSDISGTAHYANLAKMPHVLIAGATGSGKSVTIHDLIVSLLYRSGPDQLRFVMIDPKRVELTVYNEIPHLLTPVITDPKKAVLSLKWLTKEMDRRYSVLEAESVRDISSYHQNIYYPALAKKAKSDVKDIQVKDSSGTGDEVASSPEEQLPEAMPYIVTVIDELADLMQTYPRELEAAIVRLAQMSRAVGIHLVIATQRPSVKVITGLIKANIPARIALQVASQIDSRTILDMGGAENLLGAGDMLYLSGEMSKPVRIQAPYISETELKAIVKYLAKEFESRLPDDITFGFTAEGAGDASLGGIPEAALSGGMGEDSDDDDMYEDAKAAVMEAGKASTSYLQRKLRVGYSRAARLMDILEQRGVIGPADGAKPREVIGAQQSEQSSDES